VQLYKSVRLGVRYAAHTWRKCDLITTCYFLLRVTHWLGMHAERLVGCHALLGAEALKFSVPSIN